MIKLPDQTTGMWEQNNRSDTLGTLFSSFNLNLTDQLGKTKVSGRLIITTNGIANLGCPVAFRQFNSKLYTVAGSFVFIAPSIKTETPFVKDTGSNTPTGCSSNDSDLENFNSNIWTTGTVGGNDNLYFSAGSSWSLIDNGGGSSSLTPGVPHKLLSFLNTNRLYVTDGNRVLSTDTSAMTLPTSGQFTFTIGGSLASLNIVSIISVENLIWILTVNSLDQIGYVFTWDGNTVNTPTDVIPLDSRGALAGIVKNGTIYIITVDGRLQYHNGQTFVDAKNGQLPVSLKKYLKNPLDVANDRWIHPNGITLINGRINILVNNENYDSGATINESLPSGIWEYDDTIGWYHKNAITLFDTGVGTISDYGQNRVSRVGALSNIRSANNSSDAYVGTILVGATYFLNPTTTVNAIYTNDSLDTVQKYGYIVTTKITAKNVLDSWQKFYARIKNLLSPTDEIIVKYRTNDNASAEYTVGWNDATRFTVSTDLTSSIGYEVEGTLGTGSGRCAHITNVQSAGGGNFIVTLDETLGASTGISKLRVQNWIKLDTFSNQNLTYIEFGNMGNSTWVQIKVCMLFTGNDELYDIIVENQVFQ